MTPPAVTAAGRGTAATAAGRGAAAARGASGRGAVATRGGATKTRTPAPVRAGAAKSSSPAPSRARATKSRGSAPSRGGATKSRGSAPSRGGATKARATAAPGHRRTLRKPTAPRAPRRVSGPAGGRAGAGVITRPARIAIPKLPNPLAPRRSRRSRTASRSRAEAGIRARAGAFIRSLPDHGLLDRIVRGRAWIALLGVMLAGIVAMQVEVLKLSSSIGRSLERSSALESRNELLRANVATLADDQRIEQLAAKMGMVMPGPTQIGFLSPAGNLNHALANIHSPDPSGFASLLSSSGGLVSGTDATASTGSGGTGSPTTDATASTGSGAAGVATAATQAPSQSSGTGGG